MGKALLLIVLSAAVVLTPVIVDARHGNGWEGVGAGLCIGLPLGCLLAQPAAAPPPPPPPATCYRNIPEHWETRWDPVGQRYYSIYHPPQVVSYPCR
jgi:hypothetical protein